MTRMSEIEWEPCFIEPRKDPEFERRYFRQTGRPGFVMRPFLPNPWLEGMIINFSVEGQRQVAIDSDLAELVAMVVSQDNSCRFCFAATRMYLRLLGMPQERITRIEHDLLTGDFDKSELAALEFARRVSQSNPLPTRSDVDTLRAEAYDDLQIAEIAGVIGLTIFFNRLSTLAALPVQRIEKIPDHWGMKLLRPLIARRVRGRYRKLAPSYLGPDAKNGAFSHVVVGLDGLEVAGVLRNAIDGMWESPVLSKRCKALVVAVVARALGCPVSEEESARLLLAEGIGPEQRVQILDHLAAPILDPVERIVVPFARETVWYQPVQIQRRGREVMEALSREQFIELVGVAALANGLCRLGFLAQMRG